jgi:replicative DNA helicase
MLIEEVIHNVESGREGKNVGLFMGYPKLQDIIPGVQMGTVYNVAGGTGSGKTAFVLSSFCLNPYDSYLTQKAAGIDIELEIIIWSMEMSAQILMTKAVARKIFKDYHILTDINMVLSRGKNKCSQEIYDLVLKTRKYFEEFENIVTIHTSSNPTGIHKAIKSRVMNNGKETWRDLEITEHGQPKTIQQFVKYTPNHPNHYLIAIQDHIALQKTEVQTTTVKGVIDKLVNYIIDDKLRYNITDVLVQQVNRSAESVDRQRTNSIDVMLSDLRDSSDTAHSADYVIGLANPYQFEIPVYRNYDIKRLQDRFRSIKVLKSRDGISNVVVGMGFIGEVGIFKELPEGKLMTETDYKQILQIKKYNT